MWADAQRDGRPAEYRWRPLREFRNFVPCIPCRKLWLTPTARLPCSKAANIGEHKTSTESELCTQKNSVRGQESPKMYI